MAAAAERLADVAEQRLEWERRRERRAEEAASRAFQDRIGARRDMPRRLSFVMMADGVPGLATQFSRTIPAEFWSLDGSTATIACPCGEEPRSEDGCPIVCACERAYLYDGQDVRVAFGPNHEPAPEDTDEPEAR